MFVCCCSRSRSCVVVSWARAPLLLLPCCSSKSKWCAAALRALCACVWFWSFPPWQLFGARYVARGPCVCLHVSHCHTLHDDIHPLQTATYGESYGYSFLLVVCAYSLSCRRDDISAVAETCVYSKFIITPKRKMCASPRSQCLSITALSSTFHPHRVAASPRPRKKAWVLVNVVPCTCSRGHRHRPAIKQNQGLRRFALNVCTP